VPAPAEASSAAAALLEECLARGLTIACAESCTGGLVTAALTDIPGSSAALWGGAVAYSNECKKRLLGVGADEIAAYGAVSREVAGSMAAGILEASGADIALAVTGIAGPSGGSEEKPVGLVWFAWRTADGRALEACERFAGSRGEVRSAAAERAMRGALALAREISPRRS
jgi:nicotinamide-nucleotide amidase